MVTMSGYGWCSCGWLGGWGKSLVMSFDHQMSSVQSKTFIPPMIIMTWSTDPVQCHILYYIHPLQYYPVYSSIRIYLHRMTVCVSTSSQSTTPPTNDLSNRSCPDPGCGASVLLMTAQNQCSNCEEKFCNKIYTDTRHTVMEKSKYFPQTSTKFFINLISLKFNLES